MDTVQPTEQTPQPNIQDELIALLKKHHVRMETTIDFPMYKELPDEVKLALLVLNKAGGVIKVLYLPDTSEEEKA